MTVPTTPSADDKIRILIENAKSWLRQDPDEETRTELTSILNHAEDGDQAAQADLRDRFGGRLTFGTAGLRAGQGAGPNRMNRVVVAQTAEGIARHLGTATAPSIVIGYDARKNSAIYARDTVEIFAGHGFETLLLPRALPTPVLAFAVRQLGCTGGIMVTASHNPPADNGYKVYLGGADLGAQIVSPEDQQIAERIAEAALTDIRVYPRSECYDLASEELVAQYIARAAGDRTREDPSLRYVYTAMHGVGWETAREVFTRAGFSEPIPVREQVEPDATFPTVEFPNPEEPGALDLAFRYASENDADLIIANDPDADRLAVAAPFADGWRMLTGNEIGQLLGWRIAVKATSNTGPAITANTLATSLVSSPALRAVAETMKLNYEETLTGFKWISRANNLLFGFEEALGYLVDPDAVRDKDGISAAREFLALATELKNADVTIEQSLERFASIFGGFASEQVSIRVTELSAIDGIMGSLRADVPASIGGRRVEHVHDYLNDAEEFPASDILRFELHGRARVIIRPSGTEPKLKAYIDTRSKNGSGDQRLVTARDDATELATAVGQLVYARL